MLKQIFKKWREWNIFGFFPYRLRMYYYDYIKPIICPNHKKIRSAVPRNWQDITSLIVSVNFAMIKEFYEDEYLLGIVDWENSSEDHKKFEHWLKEAYAYICYKRPSLEAEMENSYPPSKPFNQWFEEKVDENGKKTYQMIPDKVPYEIRYKDVIRLEKEISENDSKFLKEMIEYREFFWT